MILSLRTSVPLVSLSFCLLTGCGVGPMAAPTAEQGLAIHGKAFGGQNPINGAHVYLMAANTTGYGAASVSLLSAASTGHSDSTGAYVLSDGNGNFTITNDYSCTANTQVYLLTQGGDPGSGSNSAASLMAVLGNCPAGGSFASSIPFVTVNEITTVAAAYAMAGFATDATHVSSSGTTQALVGIANAFANAGNLANLGTGTALATTPAGNGTVPQTRLISLGNILASCINSTGVVTGPTNPTTCYTLFSNTKNLAASPVATPTETATAAINLAHFPGTATTAGVTALYGLIGPTAPFGGGLTKAPKDFVIGIAFTGDSTSGTSAIAIDANGNAWVANSFCLSELSPLGAVLSGASGFGSSTLTYAQVLAIDPANGNVWVGDNGTIDLFSNTGALVAAPLSATNLTVSSGQAISMAVGLNSNVWVDNYNTAYLGQLSSTGTLLYPAVKVTGNVPYTIMPLTNGNAWVVSQSNLALFSPTGADITPASLLNNSDLFGSGAAVVDASGNVWLTQMGYFVEAGPDGTELSPAAGYTGGGNDTSFAAPNLSIDGDGTLWQGNVSKKSLTAFSTTRKAAVSTSSGFGNGVVNSAYQVAIDPSGNAWVETYNTQGIEGLTELIGIAAPVVTPLNPNFYGVRP